MRGLAVLAGLAAVLLLILLVTKQRDGAPVDRSLVPGFDASRVHEIVISRGRASSTIKRIGKEWRFTDPPGVADPAAIDAIFTALRGGRWHRRAAADRQEARATLTFDGTTFAIGAEVPGTGQTWLVRGSDQLLVDTWIANALMPDPIALRIRQPLAGCTTADAIVATTGQGALRLVGTHLIEPRNAWIDEPWLRALADACARIELVTLGPGQRAPAPGLRIVLERAQPGQLVEVGTCDAGRVLVDTQIGAGCVDRARFDELQAALQTILQKPHDTIDLRPLPIEPVKITLPDGTVLDLQGRARIGDAEADPERVRELVTALTSRGRRVVGFPRTRPRGTIFAVSRDSLQVAVALFDKVVARSGELGAIEVDDATWAILTRPAAALRDPTLWREDAATISSIELDHVTYKRGAVLGEWIREPAGAVDPKLVDALAETLASVRAPAGARPTRTVHRLRVTFTPPAGAPITHELAVGPATDTGCPARVDNAPVVLPLPLCTAALALGAAR